MWRSRPAPRRPWRSLVSHAMKVIVAGRRPPAPAVRRTTCSTTSSCWPATSALELIEVREDEQVERRLPERAFTSLLDAGGRAYDSPGLRALPGGAPPVRARPLLRRSAARSGCELDDVDHRLSLGPADAAAPARARRAARAALPRPQDPGRRALPLLRRARRVRPALPSSRACPPSPRRSPTSAARSTPPWPRWPTGASPKAAPTLERPRRPATATTRRTRRCCWRRCCGGRRATSPSDLGEELPGAPRRRARSASRSPARAS